jgi:transcriptional regulator with XRE-family HTH domain
MSMLSTKANPKFIRAYDRGMLRSAFVSLFWAVITERKKWEDFTFRALAKALGVNKGEVSRWFNGDPNWTINTIANIAHALNVELRIQAIDRKSGKVFTPIGVQSSEMEKRPTTGGVTRAGEVILTRVPQGSTGRAVEFESAA